MKTTRNSEAADKAGPRRGRPRVFPDSPPKTRSSPARSPARTRRSSPPPAAAPRSPSRRSPARRSPARNASAKYPARKSPARVAETKKSPSRKPTKSEQSIDLKPKLSEPTVMSRSRRSEYSIKDFSVAFNQVEMSIGDRINGLEKKERVPRATVAPQIIRRSSARLRDSASQPSSSSRVSESASRSLDIALDDDSQESETEPAQTKKRSIGRKLATPMRGFGSEKGGGRSEFGGRIGSALLIVLEPLCVFLVLAFCAKTCELQVPRLVLPSVATIFSTRASVIVASQVLLQTAICAFNICGTRVNRLDDSGQQHYFNGIFASIISVITVFITKFFNILSLEILLEEYLRLAVLSYILATLLAIGLFWKSKRLSDEKLNPNGNTGYPLYDFWMGRELFPQLGRIDLKVLLHRICNVNGLIISILIFAASITFVKLETFDVNNYPNYINHLKFNPSLLVISAMQLIYCLNLIYNERKIVTTFSWQSEGVGYLQTVSNALYPFYFLTVSKYILENKIQLPLSYLIASITVYSIGFILYRLSNNIKHEFRINPVNPKLSHLEVMPTFLGKRLMTSGPWGLVRHPNYLGDIILHLALCLPALATGVNASIAAPLTTVAILVHRVSRDNGRCMRRYGAAWQRYSLKVSGALLPKVY